MKVCWYTFLSQRFLLGLYVTAKNTVNIPGSNYLFHLPRAQVTTFCLLQLSPHRLIVDQSGRVPFIFSQCVRERRGAAYFPGQVRRQALFWAKPGPNITTVTLLSGSTLTDTWHINGSYSIIANVTTPYRTAQISKLALRPPNLQMWRVTSLNKWNS
jgi:hypothetical protein